MQKYSTYKPTNVEWLGIVPTHWEVDTLKNHCEIFASNVDKKTEADEIEVTLCNYVDVYKNQQIDTSIEFMKATATQAEIEKFTLQLNDIILTKDSETPNDIAVPSIVKEVFENFLCGYHLSIIRCLKKIEPDFLIWVLRDLNIATQFHREAIGITRYGLASKHFKNGIITFPGRTEQTAIAEYLNQATEHIDKVIATKQKQLEQLEQWKQSKIHECVTKGINPNVNLKTTEFEFIGEVPTHWKVERLKFVLNKIGSGVTPKGGSAIYLDTGIPLIRSQNVHNNGLDFSDIACITQAIHDDMSGSKVLKGDVLLNITGASIGRCYYYNLDDEANVNQHVCILRHNHLMTTNFLYYLMISEVGQSQIFSGFKGSGREGLGNEAIKVFRIPLPKTKEQKEIAKYLDFFCNSILKEKEIIEQQIDKLKLYRKCLIHECVTGKRKVTE